MVFMEFLFGLGKAVTDISVFARGQTLFIYPSSGHVSESSFSLQVLFQKNQVSLAVIFFLNLDQLQVIFSSSAP